MLLYNFPARTGYDLKPEVVLELARRRKNIVGIKDTVDVMGHTRELIQTVKREYPEFLVYSGFDEFFSHNVISGGTDVLRGCPTLLRKQPPGLHRQQEKRTSGFCGNIR